EECNQCIASDLSTADELESCIEEQAQDLCGAVFSSLCCNSALSGNDCMANDFFVAFIECLVVDLDSCSVEEDWTCSDAGDAQVADNGAGPVTATA
ncbi:unnamed protein product, partial [Pylaiella littoralis]